MKCGKTFEEFEALNGISVEEILSVFEAVSQAYPMIVSANLTKNTYTMIKDDGFLAGDLPISGRFDDLIDFGVEIFIQIIRVCFWRIFPERDYYDCLDRESARYMPSFIKRGMVTSTNGFPVM